MYYKGVETPLQEGALLEGVGSIEMRANCQMPKNG